MSKLGILFGFLKLKLPEAVVARISGRLPQIAGRRIDPKAHAASQLVAALRDANQMPSVEESRAQLALMATKFEKPCPATVTCKEILLPGAEGDRPARLYLPEGIADAPDTPTLFYLHGGGWVQGSIDTHDGLCGRLADLAGLRVISYDYRLAPEHKFPAAADDILACYRALQEDSAAIQVDPTRLVVGGDSAGGNLAACLMHDIAHQRLPKPRGQLLIYPGLDARLTSQSMMDLREQPLLPAARIGWYLDLYLPEGQDRLDPRVSPLFSNTLTGQPQALIIVGGHDPLWDDAQVYAGRLREAGVTVHQLDYPGQIHAFMSLTKALPQGNQAIEKTALWLRRVLHGD